MAAVFLGTAATPVSAEMLAEVLPARLSLTTRPGETVREIVTVANRGSEPMVVRLRWADLAMDTTGSLSLLRAGSLPATLDSLVAFEPSQFSLQPGESGAIHVALTMPARGPATRWGVLLSEVRSTVIPSGRFGPRVTAQLGSTFYLSRVPADAIRPEVTDMRTGPCGHDSLAVRVRIRNAGERHFYVSGQIAVADSAGRIVRSGDLPTGVVFPAATRDFTWTSDAGLAPGRYKVTATLDSGQPELLVGETWMEWRGAAPPPVGPQLAGAPLPPGER